MQLREEEGIEIFAVQIWTDQAELLQLDVFFGDQQWQSHLRPEGGDSCEEHQPLTLFKLAPGATIV
jgi:hypothetical protein